jgi:ribosomal protein S27AE
VGKTRNREAKSDEYLRGQIRQLRKENQQLRKLVAHLQGQGLKKERSPKKLEEVPNCPECGKGFLSEIEFANRIFDVCGTCGYRSKLKRILKRVKK